MNTLTLIVAILFLIGQILIAKDLLKPISEIQEIRFQKAVDTNSKYKPSYLPWVLLFLFITNLYSIICFYLFSKYVNIPDFTIYTMILIIIQLVECFLSLIYINKLDTMIKLKCNEILIIKDRVLNAFSIIYIAFVLIKFLI